jgi:hypothetical protein
MLSQILLKSLPADTQLIEQISNFVFMLKSKKLLAGIIITFSVLLATFSFYFYQVVKTPNLQVDKKIPTCIFLAALPMRLYWIH